MSTYPDFDDDWRKHDSAARAAKPTLQDIVNDDSGPKDATTQSAVGDLFSRYDQCQKLSECINASYKGLKRDHAALSEKASTADKLKEEKKHAVIKAKEYRAQIKILQKKVVDLGGSVDDVKATIVQNRKRGIDQVELEDNLNQGPMKRNRNGNVKPAITVQERLENRDTTFSQSEGITTQFPTIFTERSSVQTRKRGIDQIELEADSTQEPIKRSKHEKKNPGTIVKEPSEQRETTSSHSKNITTHVPTPSPSRSNTSTERSSPATSNHTAPVPRRKRSLFRNIPFHLQNKFVGSRNLVPNKLLDPTQQSSHVTAVFQALAATVKAHEAYYDLPSEAKDAKDFRLLRNSLTLSEINEEVGKQAGIPPSKAFVDFLADVQHEHTRPLNMHPLQSHLESQSKSKSLNDPVAYAEQVLKTVSTLYIEDAFKPFNTIKHFCAYCNTQGDWLPGDENPYVNKPDFAHADTELAREWITALHPHNFTERETRSGKPATRHLDALLREKMTVPKLTMCKTCSFPNKSHHQMHWYGYAYSPSILASSYDRNTKSKQYKLTLPIEHDFAAYVQASGEKTKYRLVTVIKKLKSGMCAAFVHTEDGK
ncbi:hypothetical protein N0V83_003029 [Neocucurbitaria cava]|uniref:Uncharacterized protein n=1 Tax=Neocucurbitaria cava TaxID=798079 RepID=A0A9W8YEU0_9PLEO|nr:hypothetical protein N0V83_003029 [Neocucurbitaria cava]